MSRPIYEIAREITKSWKNPYFGAVPYIEAMATLDRIDDMYYEDTAEYILAYFLGNANTFRGEDARHLKTEIKELLKGAKQ